MRTLPIHLDRLDAALRGKGVRLKRHSLIEVATAAFGYHAQNQMTAAAAAGDLDPPAAVPIGRVRVAGHDLSVAADGEGRPFAFRASDLGDDRAAGFATTPYGGLVDLRGLGDLPTVDAAATRSEELHAATVTHKHGDTLYLDRTEHGLRDQLADYCREWWKEVGGRRGVPETPEGLDDQETIDTYFEDNDRETLVLFSPESYPIGPVDFGRDAPFVPEGFDMRSPYVIGRMMPSAADETVLWWSDADGWVDATSATVLAAPTTGWPTAGIVPGALFVVPLPTPPAARKRTDVPDVVFLTNRECDVQGPSDRAEEALPWVAAEEIEVGMGPLRTAEIGYAALVDDVAFVAPTIKAFHFDADDSVRAMLSNRNELQEYADAIEPRIRDVGGLVMMEEDTEAVTLTVFVPLAEARRAPDLESWKAALQDLLTPDGDGERVFATFRPQTIIGDSCYDADPHGEVGFDVTYEVKLMGEEAARGLHDHDDEAESLKYAVRAPRWIREWTGPFGVEVRQALADRYGFDPDDAE
jgi:hypothetical protein